MKITINYRTGRDSKSTNERIVVEALNQHFFDNKLAKGPYPTLYCDRCNHLDHWQPAGVERNERRGCDVQVWKCACGRQTETGVTIK